MIGGGNSARQATLFLSSTCRSSTRRARCDAEPVHVALPRLTASRHRNVEIHHDARRCVSWALTGRSTAVVVENNVSPPATRSRALDVRLLGASPHERVAGGLVDLDRRRLRPHRPATRPTRRPVSGEGAVHEPLLPETSLPGVFAVGGRSGSIKRVARRSPRDRWRFGLVQEHLVGRQRADHVAQQAVPVAVGNARYARQTTVPSSSISAVLAGLEGRSVGRPACAGRRAAGGARNRSKPTWSQDRHSRRHQDERCAGTPRSPRASAGRLGGSSSCVAQTRVWRMPGHWRVM